MLQVHSRDGTSFLGKQQDARVKANDKDCESYNKLRFMAEDRLGKIDITYYDYWTPVHLPPNSPAYRQRIQDIIDTMGTLVENP